MRILVLGAGGIGGYFGGRLAEQGKDVTFLVRPKRKASLEKNGLVLNSVNGNYAFQPKLITAQQDVAPFDIVLLSSKAYHLEQSIEDLRPFVGPNTVIIPLLNGIAHIATLQQAFGHDRVMGGLCIIETTLDPLGEVSHTSDFDQLIFGELDGEMSERAQHIADAFADTKAKFMLSEHIKRDMWHKYLMITVLSSVTTLMHAPIGPIRDSEGGKPYIEAMYQEVANIMRAHQAPISDDIVKNYMKSLDNLSYHFKTSMQRDMERGLNIEGQHIQGYILSLANQYDFPAPLLTSVYQNLNVYNEMLS
ncbi:2-dehydropantoate 2-reductase [Staphylococcus arlettae]|uniref:2-dehydropantoate 2-reductase n=2 Tax=Staphylococcus arlettae TaxID=29378 RepID=UPI00028236DF|nr:2-dehydropantoate 2-reductase [Staphylococcus arlettae]EJY96885.1 2-dehydropantoate 2-reductase [Staphylococcus arlettae CVD059]MCD9055578.1 2-dehydropantoate 2-reductase [Staphylococcus arlettae]MDT3893245.1 2-dehydropantoate 2-reductase [Staphylococcus arlettae]QZZ03843.1 2-dehydropantoate 2-reductase [Staphylococcus arlettae]UXU50242.1 2-dehydropantoate 2-reductase [Staphylococcus arlettae]